MSSLLARRLLLVALAPLGACATVARPSLAPIVTDRPDFTESSETVPRGMRQLESGGSITREGGDREVALGEGLLRVGLSNRTELRLGLNSYNFSRTGGLRVRGHDDASIGAKVRLLAGGATGSARPAVALIVATSLPTGASPYRVHQLQPEVKLTSAWDLTDRVAFASNLNYAWVREPQLAYGIAAASGSLSIGLTERVGSYVEYYGFVPTTAQAPRSHFGNGGLTMLISDNLQLDGRVGTQLARAGRSREYFFGLGLSRRW